MGRGRSQGKQRRWTLRAAYWWGQGGIGAGNPWSCRTFQMKRGNQAAPSKHIYVSDFHINKLPRRFSEKWRPSIQGSDNVSKFSFLVLSTHFGYHFCTFSKGASASFLKWGWLVWNLLCSLVLTSQRSWKAFWTLGCILYFLCVSSTRNRPALIKAGELVLCSSAPCWVKHGLGVAIQILGNFLVLFCHFTQEARVPSPNYCFKTQRIMILILKDNTFISIKKFKHYDSTSICLCFEWLHIYKVIVEKQKGEDDFLVAKKWEKVRNILWRSNSFLAIYNGNTLTCVSYFT